MSVPGSPNPVEVTASVEEPQQRPTAATSVLPAGERPGDTIGPYHILEVVGEGGFGMVYVAEQRTPVRRRVALKIVKAGMDTKEVIARFEAERQALALLDHPNVAKVFDAGATANGRPYFAMEFVPGLPITDYCNTAKLRTRERIELFIPVCQAVQHAHQKGIIHRDLKPGNILVTLFDGRPVPKVIDFGIAKAANQALTQRTLYTETGRLMGTPEYMSPEQAGTSGLDVDTRTDIYSLGVILYQLLTGTLPFDPKTLRQAGSEGIARIIREMDPPKPSTRLSTLLTDKAARAGSSTPTDLLRTHGADFRTLISELRGDLDWITLKAMAKERARRYETANGFAMDLRRYLNHELVLARPPSLTYRLSKFARRYRTTAAVILLIAAALTFGLAAATIGYFQAQSANQRLQVAKDNLQVALEEATRARDEAQVARDQTQVALGTAQAARTEAEFKAYIASLAAAAADLRNDDGAAARRRLEQAPEPLRGWEWHFLWNDADQSIGTALDLQQAGKSWQVELSPDGSLLAARASPTAGDVLVREVKTGREIWRFPIPDHQDIDRIKFSADNQWLGLKTVGTTGPRLFNLRTGRQHVPTELQAPGNRLLAIDGAGTSAVVALPGRGQPVKVYQVEGWRETCTLASEGKARFAQDAEFSPDGRWIALAGGSNDSFSLYDARTGEAGKEILAKNWVTALGWSLDGDHLAAFIKDSSVVRIWDTARWTFGETPHLEVPPQTLAFTDSASGRLLVLPGARTVRLWSLDGKPVASWRGPDAPVDRVAVGRGELEGWLFTASGTGVVKKWDLSRPTSIHAPVTRLAPVGGGALLAVGLEGTMSEPVAALFDPLSMRRVASYHYPPECDFMLRSSRASGLSISPDQTALLVGCGSGGHRIGRFKVFDLTTGLARFTTSPERPAGRVENGRNVLLPHDDDITDAAFSPDGQVFATASADRSIRLWNARTFQQSGVLSGHQGAVNRIVFSADGTLLASASADGTARIWNLQSGRAIATLSTHGGPVKDLLFIRSDTQLLTASDDGSVRIWDAASGAVVGSIDRAHLGAVNCLALSPDGGRLASGSMDRTVKLWDTATWREMASLAPGGNSGIGCLAFLPDGLRLLCWTADRGLMIWDATPEPVRAEERRNAAAAERIARPLVTQLIEQTGDPGLVRQRLRSDATLSEPVRRAAELHLLDHQEKDREDQKRAAFQWVQATMLRALLEQEIVTDRDKTPIDAPLSAMIAQLRADPQAKPLFKEAGVELAAACWNSLLTEDRRGDATVKMVLDLVRYPFCDPAMHRHARLMLEGIVTAESPWQHRLALGQARYRDGDYQGALTPPSALAETAARTPLPIEPASLFVIMAHQRAGNTQPAADLFETLLTEALRQPDRADDALGGAIGEAAFELGGVDLLLRTLERIRVSLEPGTGTVAGVETIAIQCLLAAGRYQEAEAMAARAAGEMEGRARPALLGTPLQFRGAALNAMNRFDQAAPVLHRALAVREAHHGRWDWRTCETRTMLGEALAGQKKYAEAELLLVEGYKGWVLWPNSNYTRRRDGIARIVRLYEAWGRTQQAAQWRQRLESLPK